MKWICKFIACIAEFQQRRADLYLQHLSNHHTSKTS